MTIGLAAIFGAIAGSLLNVVAHRLPRHESLLPPTPRCPECGTPLTPYVPVLGRLWRRRCRGCGAQLSRRDPAVEALTALLCAVAVLEFGLDGDVWLPLVFVLLLVPITLIDLDFHIIPNALTLIGAVAAIALTIAFEPGQLTERLIAAAAAGGFFLVAAIVYPAGMGIGDVKLAGVMGLVLGRAVAPAIFVALLLGSAVGVAVVARHGVREGRKKGIPFGPWLAVGSLVGLFAGDAIVDWYLDSFTA